MTFPRLRDTSPTSRIIGRSISTSRSLLLPRLRSRARLWLWLAVTAIVLGALWTLPGTDVSPVEAIGAHVFNALAGFVLAAVFLVSGLMYGPTAKPGDVEWVSTLSLSVYVLVTALLVFATGEDAVPFTAFVILTAATAAIAWRTEAATAAVPVAAILAIAVMADWAVPRNLSNLIVPAGPAAPAIADPQRYDYGSHFLLATGWAAMFGIAGFLAQAARRARSRRSYGQRAPLWCRSQC